MHEQTSLHLLLGAQDQRLGVEQDQLPCGSGDLFWQLSRDRNLHCSGMSQATTASPKNILQSTLEVGRCCGWQRKMLDGQHQRMGILAYARAAHKDLLLKRLEKDLRWIVPHVPTDDPVGQVTELILSLSLSVFFLWTCSGLLGYICSFQCTVTLTFWFSLFFFCFVFCILFDWMLGTNVDSWINTPQWCGCGKKNKTAKQWHDPWLKLVTIIFRSHYSKFMTLLIIYSQLNWVTAIFRACSHCSQFNLVTVICRSYCAWIPWVPVISGHTVGGFP